MLNSLGTTVLQQTVAPGHTGVASRINQGGFFNALKIKQAATWRGCVHCCLFIAITNITIIAAPYGIYKSGSSM